MVGEFPLSLFDFLKLIEKDAAEHLGDLTFPMVAQLIGDSLLTFFMIYFIAKWVFDILTSFGKGRKR